MTGAITFDFVPPVNAGAVALLLYAAARDIAARRVPNWIPVALALLGTALQLRAGLLGPALVAAAAVFAASYAAWLQGWVGGADAKLLAAAALLVPPSRVPDMLIGISISGGVLAVSYLLLARMRPRVPASAVGLARRALRVEAWRIRRRGPLPYAVAIGVGAFLTLCGGLT